MISNRLMLIVLCLGAATLARRAAGQESLPYRIVDTGQVHCYDDRAEIPCPRAGAAYFGQDAQHRGRQPAYRNNGDGTVTDLNTGLMWQSDPGAKKTYADARAGAARCRTGGYDDWRLPSIKELYSLILFSGADPDPRSRNTAGLSPFIDTKYFRFQYGKASEDDRVIDSQYASSTEYVSTTMDGNATVFGVNFADGRIKGYPRDATRGREAKKFYVLYVRGNRDYGHNDFVDNGDGTITDRATGLMWSKSDSGRGMNWEQALAWVQARNSERYLGHNDWRLPNAKELQSIVDYTRAPAVTHSPAIDPAFETTRLDDGEYPFFWTSTTHLRGFRDRRATAAVYVAFGRALGWMRFPPRSRDYRLLDVHGAGAQRSDPKDGDPSAYPHGRGPQGDVIRVDNYVRCVRDAK